MTIRLLRTWNGYPANAVVTLDRATEAALVRDFTASATLTGGSQWDPNQPFDVDNFPVSCESKGAFPGANANTNTGAIQAALNIGRMVTLTTPGVYQINNTLVIKENTTFLLGNGVTIYQENNAKKSLMKNESLTSSVISVSSVSAATASAAVSVVTCTTSSAHGFVVGDGFILKGDTSKQYIGVHNVLSVISSTQFTFAIPCGPTAPGAASGSLTVARADRNIAIIGGVWDYNGQNNIFTVPIDAQGFLFNKVSNLLFAPAAVLNVVKWVMHLSNSWNAVVRDCYFDTQSDGVHVSGPAYNTVIENVRGSTGDDFIAATCYLNFFAGEEITNGDERGDIIGLTCNNIQVVRSGQGAVALYPSQGYEMSGVQLTNISVVDEVRNGLYINAWATDVVTNCKDITATNWTLNRVTSDPIRVGGVGTSMAIKSLTLRDWKFGETLAGTIGLVDKAQIETLMLDGFNYTMDVASERYLIQMGTTDAKATDAWFKNIKVTTSGSASSHVLYAVGDGTNVTFENVTLFGRASLIAGNPTAGSMNVNIYGGYFDTYYVVATTGGTYNFIARGIKCGAVGVNTPFSLTGTSKTYNVRVSNCDWGGAANWLAMGTSSTYNLWWSNLGADAGGRPGISAGTTCTRRVRSSDGSFTIDGTLITSFDNGCIYVNSNAGFGAGAGTYAHGPGGPTRIAV